MPERVFPPNIPCRCEDTSRTTNANLDNWLETLPPSFVYDERNIADLDPSTYGVHMQYCKVQLLVHQASNEGRDPSTAHTVAIYDAAIQNIRLLLIYRQIHETAKIRSFMLDTVKLALATLVDGYLQNPDLIETHQRDTQWLRMAVERIIGIQPRLPVISHMLSLLALTVEGTRLELLFRAAESWLLAAPAATDTEQRNDVLETFTEDVVDVEQCPVDDGFLSDCSLLSWPLVFEASWNTPSEPLTTA